MTQVRELLRDTLSAAVPGYIIVPVPTDMHTADIEGEIPDDLEIVDRRLDVDLLGGAESVDLIVLRDARSEAHDAEQEAHAIRRKTSLADLTA